jgi:hypothetical protein
MDNLKQLFINRDNMFFEETAKLLSKLTHVTTAAATFIDNCYGLDTNRNLTWEGVNLMNDMLTLVGVVSYSPGTTLMFNNESTNITKENAEYFQQIVHINLPLLVVNSQTTDELVSFLTAQKNQHGNENDNDNIKGFNLSELTPKQLQSLTQIKSGKLN